MILFKKVAIIGIGLIGGSIAKALKQKKLCNQVTGIVHHKETIQKAIAQNVIDLGTTDLTVVKDADLVVIATPVETTIDIAFKIKNYILDKTLVMDVGSTKLEIVKAFDRAFRKNIEFIGCHPLAGSEKKGVDFSDGGIFNNSIAVLTPYKNRINAYNFNKIKNLWQSLGAEIKLLTPALHDKIIAKTSALPHLLSFSLLNTLPKNYFKFVSSGFRDTTRIGASDPQMWNDILISNKREVVFALEDWQKEINKLKKLIQSKNQSHLKKYISSAKAKRESI
ncbi:MAG: prephenate dehydrogenase/arogenate dehydrogenase family protein [Candidatus Omnitrophota bacterium]